MSANDFSNLQIGPGQGCPFCGVVYGEHDTNCIVYKVKETLSKPEPAPNESNGDVWELVIKDMQDRRKFGIDKYGTPLQSNNGRKSLIDAYQEALDLCVYLRQAIDEQSSVKG